MRLEGAGREILEHREIGALYLGGGVSRPASQSPPAGTTKQGG